MSNALVLAALERARASKMPPLATAGKAMAAQGQRGDRHLVHVNDAELAQMRRAFGRGRSGETNPVTGLESFAPTIDPVTAFQPDALGFSPTQFQPAAEVANSSAMQPGATATPDDPLATAAAMAVLKNVGPTAVKQITGLGAPTVDPLVSSGVLGVGNGATIAPTVGDVAPEFAISPAAADASNAAGTGLAGSTGNVLGTGASIGTIGTGLGGVAGIAGGIEGLTNAGNQNGVGIAGDVGQLAGGALAAGAAGADLGIAALAPLAGLGPVGLGAAAVAAIAGSLFGNKKPHNISGLTIDSIHDNTLAPLATGNDNGANTDQLQSLLTNVVQPNIDQLSKQYGFDVNGVNIGAFAHQTQGQNDSEIGLTGPVPGQGWALDPNDPASVNSALSQLDDAILGVAGIDPTKGTSPQAAQQPASPPPPPPPTANIVTADQIRALFGARPGAASAQPAASTSFAPVTPAELQKLFAA